jgi:dTDP-glucose 4,6-dehydratase
MRYFVTGGAGFIGSNYVEYLFENVQKLTGVTIFDKFTYAANPKNFEKFLNDPRLTVVKGDICDYDFLKESMKNHDFIIHIAAESHVDRSIKDSMGFIETNVLGSRNVFEAARLVKIQNLVHVSTDEVYGSLSSSFATEDFPLKPNSPYAASKASSDLIARSYFKTYGLDIRITRCSNNYGPNQFPEKLVPLILSRIKQGQSLPLYGSGKNIREWIHVKDHCKAIHLVQTKGKAGEIYNIGTGLELSNLELVQMIIDLCGAKKSQINFIEDRLAHDFRYSLNSEKIRKMGFEPDINLRRGLEDLIKSENLINFE